MAVPKKKRSRMKGRNKRAQQKLSQPQYVNCPNCKLATQPHHVCTNCGHYKGKEIIREAGL